MFIYVYIFRLQYFRYTMYEKLNITEGPNY
jgi:hypothetical protein